MNKKDVADILEEIGILLELKGENPFKVRAYSNAARAVSGLTEDLTKLVETNEIVNIQGIGKALAEKISTLVTTGRLPYYDELKSGFPPALLELLKVPGLGPKKVRKLHDSLGISSLLELEYACNENRLTDLEGFGEKTQQNILHGITSLRKYSEKFHYPVAENAAKKVLDFLKTQKTVIRAETAGSLRRRKEIIGDIDILASSSEKDRADVMKKFVSMPGIGRAVAEGKTKSTVILESGIHVDLRVVSENEFPFALHYFTGSKEHNVQMRRVARQHKLKLNEYGLFRESDDSLVSCKNEKEIFEKMELFYIPPELREDTGEIEASLKGELPDLIDEKDLRGAFHCHTTYSDGANTVKEMADAAIMQKWEYLGIADHSQSAKYARGLTQTDIRKQRKEIDSLNEAYGKKFTLLHGIESDILSDGSLDYDERILESFDYIVASVHGRFKMSEKEMTARIIKAVKNKYTTILGHPTGRLLLSRDGYPVDLIQVIDAAADYGTAIEINSHPYRLDLDWRMVKYAAEKGVTICINPDAHTAEALNDVRFGINVARKGWLEPADVLNTKPINEVVRLFGNKRN